MVRFKVLLILILSIAIFSCAHTEPSGPRTVVYKADGSKIVTTVEKEQEKMEKTVVPMKEETVETVPVTIQESEEAIVPGEGEKKEEAEVTVSEDKEKDTVKSEEEKDKTEEKPVIVESALPNTAEECEVKTEESEQVTPIEKGDMSNIVNGFNYAYGVKNMNDLKAGSVSIVASYFTLGLYDASLDSTSPRFLSYSEIQNTINDYIAEYYSLGITFDKGERPLTIEELIALAEPEDLKALFSYAYGFSIVSDLVQGGIDIEIMSFMTGMLDCLYSETSPLTDDEIQNTLNLYILYLNEEYYQNLENIKEANKIKAEKFLEENKANGVTVLENGVQLMILDEDEVLGAKPTQYDTVLMDYNEYVLDYESGDLEIIDSEFGVEIGLMNVSSGLQSAVTNMNVGQAVRAFIPPELSLLEDGDGDTIEPYPIIVYDIALNAIL